MQTENIRKYLIISVAIAILFLLIELILFWNSSVAGKSPGIWPFICFLIAILTIGYTFNLSFKATDPKLLSEQIEKQVAQERLRIYQELEKKDETDSTNNDSEIIENSIKEIIPKGNFKNAGPFLGKFMKNLANSLEIVQGIIYIKEENSEEYTFSSGFALTNEKEITPFKIGETIPGQVAQTGEITYINDLPDEYFTVESGLGKSKPNHLVFLPLYSDNNVVAVIELAVFKEISPLNKEILKQLTKEMSIKLSQTIKS